MRMIVCGLLFVIAAGNVNAQRQAATADKVIVSDDRYVISYRAMVKDIVFTMEDLRARDGGAAASEKLPFSYFGMMIDINRNGSIDNKTDVAIGIMKNSLSICTQYLINATSSTGCGYFVTAAFYEKSSRRTDRVRYSHVVHRFIVPRSDITKPGQRTINVIFHCSTEGDNFFASNSYYPALDGNGVPRSFSRVMVLKI